MKLKSYAKVNLFLHVLSKRKDGFHNLETLFERISLCDEIILTPRTSGIRILTTHHALPKNEKNIAYRAAQLLKDQFKIQKGVTIEIKKHIPISAGLGGGSSNAATVLLGLNRLWKLKLTQKQLISLGSALGSDVAFFLLETPFAMGTGRGEILRKISSPGVKIWHCVVKPSFGISTKEAYQALRPTVLTPLKPNVKMLLHSIKKGRFEALGKLLTNSLEGSINKRVMTILNIKEKLRKQGASFALMSGSGSAVFGIFSTQKKAENAARAIQKKNPRWKVFMASTA